MKLQRTQINRLLISLTLTAFLVSGIAYAAYTQCGHHTVTIICTDGTPGEPEQASCPNVPYCPGGDPPCGIADWINVTCTHTYGTCTRWYIDCW